MCPISYQALHAYTEKVCLCFIHCGSNYQLPCDKLAVSAVELYKTHCYFTDWKMDVLSLYLSRSQNKSMLELEKYGIFLQVIYSKTNEHGLECYNSELDFINREGGKQ